MSSGYSVKVGIDFGTVTTEVAYIWSPQHPNSLKSIDRWPGASHGNRIVPSIISFNADHHMVGWGHGAGWAELTYAWSKLFLDSNTMSQELTDPALHTISNSSILRPPTGRQPEEVVGEFLKQILTFTLRYLTENEGLTDSKPIDFIFTIPISWSMEARRSMERAIQLAGFGSCPSHKWYIVSEPEAAATAIFSRMPHAFQLDDGVLICDIGGGTVDVIACHITEVHNVVLFEELAAAVGGQCGSAAIDSRFYQLLADRLGIRLQDLPQIYSTKGKILLDELNLIKINFTGDEQTVRRIPMFLNPTKNDLSLYDPKARFITPKPDHIKQLFEPVIEQIYRLVRYQIEAAHQKFGRRIINKVVITGGLGVTSYVRRRLQDFLNQARGLDIEPLITPPEPDAIVARGAAQGGLVGPVNPSRRSWRHYGIAAGQNLCWPFPTRDQVNLELSNQIPCNWFFEKSIRYTTGRRPPLTVQMLHVDGEPSTKELVIWGCNLDHPPRHVDETCMVRKATLICCFIYGNLNDCVQGEYNGRRVYMLDISVDIAFEEHTGKVSMAAAAFGHRVGETSFLDKW